MLPFVRSDGHSLALVEREAEVSGKKEIEDAYYPLSAVVGLGKASFLVAPEASGRCHQKKLVLTRKQMPSARGWAGVGNETGTKSIASSLENNYAEDNDRLFA